MMGTGGTQTDFTDPEPAKKKGKKKKTKLSKEEKALAKIEKATDEIRKSGEPFTLFVDRMDKWLLKNASKAIQLLKRIDTEGEEVVTYEEFKACMLDLEIPCSSIELHLLAQLFDRNNEDEIHYPELNNGMQIVREREEDYLQADVRPLLQTTNTTYLKCACCQMIKWEGENYKELVPRYIEVLFRLATFENFKQHPGHFNQLVHSHISVYGLMQIIQEETMLHTTKLAIFTDKSLDVSAQLSPHHTLEELGFEGGTRDNPLELLLYYDYKVEFSDCPLLMCDHYFGQKLSIS